MTSFPAALAAAVAVACSNPGGPSFVRTPEGTLAVVDSGFCAAKASAEREESLLGAVAASPALASLGGLPAAPPRPRWKVRLYASHSFTTYFPSDVVFKSSRYDVKVEGYRWAERGCREFFLPSTWAKPGNNPLQVLDEPTNTYVLSIEKDGNEFFLSAFHPKYLQAQGQTPHITGTVDGVAVDGYQPVNTPFHGYVQVPGEMKLARNESTYRQMAFEAGYARRIPLVEGRWGSVVYAPGASVGVMVGNTLTVAVKKGEWWEFEDGQDRYRAQGVGASLINRLEVNGPGERFGLFYENKLSAYRIETGFLDGMQRFDLKYMGQSVGAKFLLSKPRKRRAT